MDIDCFTTVNSFPALYWPERDAVILSDLHLGLESLMVDSGVFIPKTQLSAIIDDLNAIIAEKEPRELVIVGDIKHEFSQVSKGEKEEIRDLLNHVTEQVEHVYVVKGNHDNFVIYALQNQDKVSMDTYFVLDNVCFTHGDEIPDTLSDETFDTVVIGHEHPAIAVEDDAGVTEKIHCFLHGTWNDNTLIVLPAFSQMAAGAAVNNIPWSQLSSPFLRAADPSSLEVVGIDREAGVLEFGRLTQLKQSM